MTTRRWTLIVLSLVAFASYSYALRADAYLPGHSGAAILAEDPTTTPTITSLLRQEAEDGSIEPPMTVGSDSEASNGQFVYTTVSYDGYDELYFYVTAEADYEVWGRVSADGYGSDTFWVRVDGGPDATWDIPLGPWTWVPVTHRETTETPVVQVYYLREGVHRVRVLGREARARLDVLELRPVPVGPTETPVDTATRTLTPTSTASATPSGTPTPTQTGTIPATATDTWTPTPTGTASSTPSATETQLPTNTPTTVPAATGTRTPSPTLTSTPTGHRAYLPIAMRFEMPTPAPTLTATPTVAAGWVVLLNESFEGSFPAAGWTRSSSGEYDWLARNCRAHSGAMSAWSVGQGGPGGQLPCGTYSPTVVTTILKYGPFTLQDALAAKLTFWTWSLAEYDTYFFGASTDGYGFGGRQISGQWGDWESRELDFAAVPYFGNLLGSPKVWIIFRADSRYSPAPAHGWYLDDVRITKLVGGLGADAAEDQGSAMDAGEPVFMQLPR